jgi:hypothetical protein
MLGTIFTPNRDLAKSIGFLIHAMFVLLIGMRLLVQSSRVARSF